MSEANRPKTKVILEVTPEEPAEPVKRSAGHEALQCLFYNPAGRKVGLVVLAAVVLVLAFLIHSIAELSAEKPKAPTDGVPGPSIRVGEGWPSESKPRFEVAVPDFLAGKG